MPANKTAVATSPNTAVANPPNSIDTARAALCAKGYEELVIATDRRGSAVRQTMSEKNAGEGGYWMMFYWDDPNYELHVHFKANGSPNRDHIKLTARGGGNPTSHIPDSMLTKLTPAIRKLSDPYKPRVGRN